MSEDLVSLGATSPASRLGLERLSKATVLFGHQSVGDNVLAGIADAGGEGTSPVLRLTEIRTPREIRPSSLSHFRVGHNGDPAGKMDDFARWLNEGGAPDIALMKLCYVDFTSDTDASRVFDHYARTFEALKVAHPRTVFVHVTAPLTAPPSGPLASLRKLLGRPAGSCAENRARNRYNELLLARYSGDEPIWDLATIESTLPDGRRVTFANVSPPCFALAPDYSSDGGHLNDVGRRRAAESLLSLLARVMAARPQ